MKLSNDARTRLVVVNLSLWATFAVLAVVVLGGPRGVIANHLEPIGRELGGWGGLLTAAAGLESDPIPVYEIAIDPKAVGAARLLLADPASEAGGHSHWFPARLRSEGAVHPVSLQLVDPGSARTLDEQAWRVRFDDERGPRAMGEITLYPHPRGTQAREAAIRDTASALGLLAPPHGFASVRINGSDAGVYFWSEGDVTAMLELSGRPVGAVLLPGRHLGELSHAATSGYAFARFQAHTNAASGTQPAFGPAQRQLDRLFELTDRASDEDFDRQVPQLLDVGKYLRWNALAWILGDPGVEPSDALGWYLDPVSGLLEPIVQDWTPASAGPAAGGLRDTTRLTARLLRNRGHRAERNQLLWGWVTHRDEDLVATSERRLGKSLTTLARADVSLSRIWQLREDAEFRRQSREALRERKARILQALRKAEVRTRTAPAATGSAAALAVEIEPRGLAEIQLSELRLELGSAVPGAAGPATLRLFDPDGAERRSADIVADIAGSAVTLRPPLFSVAAAGVDEASRPSEPWRLELELPFLEGSARGPEELLVLELAFRNAVTGEALPTTRLLPRQIESAENDSEIDRVTEPDIAQSVHDVIRQSGLPLALDGDTLVLPAGSYPLARTLVVPADLRLRLDPGVRLRLAPDVSIVSFRGITARGSRFEPIEIRAADPQHAWGVIGVARASERSALEFVGISGGSKLRFAGIEFDGQLSFNDADFTIQDSEITGSRAGDGLSAKRSSFAIRRTRIANNANDGVESEWSKGTIVGSLFLDNGDDGLDVADSQLSVGDSDFAGMGDKAISADEGSVVTVSETRFENSEIAIASKNGSRVDARRAVFRHNRLGFAVYRDKPQFGGARGTVNGGLFENNDRDFSAEPGSQLEIIDVSRTSEPSYRSAWESFVRSPVVSSVARSQSSMLYSSTPSNGKNRY